MGRAVPTTGQVVHLLEGSGVALVRKIVILGTSITAQIAEVALDDPLVGKHKQTPSLRTAYVRSIATKLTTFVMTTPASDEPAILLGSFAVVPKGTAVLPSRPSKLAVPWTTVVAPTIPAAVPTCALPTTSVPTPATTTSTTTPSTELAITPIPVPATPGPTPFSRGTRPLPGPIEPAAVPAPTSAIAVPSLTAPFTRPTCVPNTTAATANGPSSVGSWPRSGLVRTVIPPAPTPMSPSGTAQAVAT